MNTTNPFDQSAVIVTTPQGKRVGYDTLQDAVLSIMDGRDLLTLAARVFGVDSSALKDKVQVMMIKEAMK